MKRIILSALIFAISASSVIAGTAVFTPDVAVVAPAPAQVTDWSGFYLGGMASYDEGARYYTHYGSPANSYTYIPLVTYGGFAGYNFQKGALVFGGELAYSAAGNMIPTYTSALEYVADIKARAGFALGNALVYGVVGGSATTWNTTFNTYNAMGMNYGVGIDYRIGSRFFIGAEYLVRNVSGFSAQDPTTNGFTDMQSIELRVGLGF